MIVIYIEIDLHNHNNLLSKSFILIIFIFNSISTSAIVAPIRFIIF